MVEFKFKVTFFNGEKEVWGCDGLSEFDKFIDERFESPVVVDNNGDLKFEVIDTIKEWITATINDDATYHYLGDIIKFRLVKYVGTNDVDVDELFDIEYDNGNPFYTEVNNWKLIAKFEMELVDSVYEEE